jgi:CubicO group peptidase (beta-lactamase class C family)
MSKIQMNARFKPIRHPSFVILTFLSAPPCLCGSSTAAEPTPPSIEAVHEKMANFVTAREIAGAVTLVARRDRVVHLDAVGWADVGEQKPMRPDTIFWIASMTKPVTGAAVMLMVDEGKLSIDDPVEKHIPELGKLKLSDGTPAKITIRHLLTHTSGMGEARGEESRGIKTLEEIVKVYAQKPVQFTPGSKWQYCQSSINTAARVVEVVSGQSFPEFLEKRLFGPLGMKDTTFYLTDEQLPRLAKSYRTTKEKGLEATENFLLAGKRPTDRDRFPAANGGLFSTAPDYARFCQMVLRGGELDGRRYLKPDSVTTMTTVQSGDVTTGFTPGNGWGLGWCVIRKPQGVTAALSAGACGHGGAYGTQAWIDPKNNAAYILMVQRANFPNSDASDVRGAFQQAAAAALGNPAN